ncbi:MAG: DUF1932 domain-containing protein [Ilumatobacter sp.]
MTTSVGVLHPGTMGVTIGASMRSSATVLWSSAGRSPETVERARSAGLADAGSLAALVERCATIVSVCPPGAALAVAQSVADLGFAGTYVDANAVSPATARAVAGLFDDAVDGGIIGPPVLTAGTTRLYLSGGSSRAVAALFDESELEVRVVDGDAGAASAVKMCFAAWTKGTAALLMAINALAEHDGVADELRSEWATSMPDLVARSEHLPAAVGPKSWRFEAEMHEIADSFADAGLHDGFLRSAADTYRRISSLQHAEHPSLDDVIRLLETTTTETSTPRSQ